MNIHNLPGRDGVDVDIVLGVGLRERSTQARHGRLGRAVVRGGGAAAPIVAGNGTHVDDATEAGALHVRNHRFAHQRYTHDTVDVRDGIIIIE